MDKPDIRAETDSLVQEYLARGGKITKVPAGAVSLETYEYGRNYYIQPSDIEPTHGEETGRFIAGHRAGAAYAGRHPDLDAATFIASNTSKTETVAPGMVVYGD